jgi:selenoprotein W-related protein
MYIETITLYPSDGGQFECSVDGNLIFSKLELRRHAEPGEILGLVRKHLQENK